MVLRLKRYSNGSGDFYYCDHDNNARIYKNFEISKLFDSQEKLVKIAINTKNLEELRLALSSYPIIYPPLSGEKDLLYYFINNKIDWPDGLKMLLDVLPYSEGENHEIKLMRLGWTIPRKRLGTHPRNRYQEPEREWDWECVHKTSILVQEDEDETPLHLRGGYQSMYDPWSRSEKFETTYLGTQSPLLSAVRKQEWDMVKLFSTKSSGKYIAMALWIISYLNPPIEVFRNLLEQKSLNNFIKMTKSEYIVLYNLANKDINTLRIFIEKSELDNFQYIATDDLLALLAKSNLGDATWFQTHIYSKLDARTIEELYNKTESPEIRQQLNKVITKKHEFVSESSILSLTDRDPDKLRAIIEHCGHDRLNLLAKDTTNFLKILETPTLGNEEWFKTHIYNRLGTYRREALISETNNLLIKQRVLDPPLLYNGCFKFSHKIILDHIKADDEVFDLIMNNISKIANNTPTQPTIQVNFVSDALNFYAQITDPKIKETVKERLANPKLVEHFKNHITYDLLTSKIKDSTDDEFAILEKYIADPITLKPGFFPNNRAREDRIKNLFDLNKIAIGTDKEAHLLDVITMGSTALFGLLLNKYPDLRIGKEHTEAIQELVKKDPSSHNVEILRLSLIHRYSQYKIQRDTQGNYTNSFFCGFSKTKKLAAVKHIINVLNKTENINEEHMAALKQGDLGKIYDDYQRYLSLKKSPNNDVEQVSTHWSING